MGPDGLGVVVVVVVAGLNDLKPSLTLHWGVEAKSPGPISGRYISTGTSAGSSCVHCKVSKSTLQTPANSGAAVVQEAGAM